MDVEELDSLVKQLQEGETITKGRRTGIIAYVNQQLKLYQMNYSKRRVELISFDQMEGCTGNGTIEAGENAQATDRKAN